MKKILYTFFALLLTFNISMAQARFGVKGSLQFATVKSPGETASNLLGFQAGLLLDAPLSDNFSLRPQLLYSVKGAKQSSAGVGEIKATLNYIEFPVQLTYGIEAGPGRVVIGAGPYVAYALNGKTSGTILGQNYSENIEFGSGSTQTKRLDYGLHVSAGYELTAGLMISGYYSPGLANLNNDSATIGTTKNTAYGVSLGFLFGGN